MSNLIPAGTYLAKAGEYEFGKSTKGNEQIGVAFTISQGEHTGRRVVWYGFFNTQENADRAIKSLRAAGWTGDDLTNLEGLGSVEASVVVEVDEYQGEKKNKIAWVNSSGVAMKEKMSDQEKKALAARLKGAILASKPSAPVANGNRSGTSGHGGSAKHTAPAEPSFGGDDEIPFICDARVLGWERP